MANSSGLYTRFSGVDATLLKINGTQVTATAAEINAIDITAAGTVTASKAVVVDSNKDIGDFRNLDAVNVDAGASGTAGTVDIFPSTASKGKIAITAADSAGDTTTTLVNASQAGARTYTIPDAGASASFVMSEGAQTVNGAKTFGSDIALGAGTTINLDSATATLATNAATITKYACVVTSEALTTAGGASQAFTITLTGVAAGDLAFVQYAGGTNTTRNITFDAVTTTNTITVTVYNNTAATALNGTLIFNLLVLKA